MNDPSLLQTIRENPDQDAPRLIYADWLEEHGQQDRAEFIRVQIRLAKVNHMRECRAPGAMMGPPYTSLCGREKELRILSNSWARESLPRIGHEWMPARTSENDSQLENPTFEYERGFISSIRVPGMGLWAGCWCRHCNGTGLHDPDKPCSWCAYDFPGRSKGHGPEIIRCPEVVLERCVAVDRIAGGESLGIYWFRCDKDSYGSFPCEQEDLPFEVWNLLVKGRCGENNDRYYDSYQGALDDLSQAMISWAWSQKP